jgi:hypothetical protein
LQAFAIDARSGNPFDDGVINALQSAALARHGQRTDSVDKMRADAWKTRRDGIVAEVRRGDAARVVGRADGYHFARDLEYVHAEILAEKTPVPNGLSLFPVSTRIPLGARSHVVRRSHEAGQAVIIRDGFGQAIPRVSVSRDEETFPVRHVADAFDMDMWEAQSSDYAGTMLYGDKLRAARNVVTMKLNDLIWNGNADAGLYGVLNYPYLHKAAAAEDLANASADDTIAELMRWSHFAGEQTKGVFGADTLVTSARLINKWSTTPRSTGTDTSILKWFLGNQSKIKSVQEAWEMEGIGPSGEDGLLFYRNNLESIAVEMVQPFTSMPAQRQGFIDTIYCWASYAGTVMRDSGNNTLIYSNGIRS